MIRESSSVIGVTIRRPSSISTFINPPKKDPQKRSQKKALQLALSLADGLNQLPAGEIHCSGLPVCALTRSAGGTNSAPLSAFPSPV